MLNLRTKLLLVILIGLLAGFSVVASFRIQRDKSKITEEINRSGNERVSLMAEALSNPLAAEDYSDAESLAERVVNMQDVEKVNILDSAGRVLVARNKDTFNVESKVLKFSAPIVFAEKKLGHVEMFVSTERLNEAVKDIYKVVAIALSFTIIFFGTLIYSAVSILIVRPLEHLGKAADQLALGDYSAVLPAVKKDEIGSLVQAFSSMRESRRQSEAKLYAIFDNSPDAFIQLDNTGNITNWNDRAKSIFGYDWSEVIGKNFSIVFPEQELGLNAGYRKCYQNSDNIIGVIREVVGQRSDGSHFPLELRTSEIHFEDECAYIVSARDISERKNSEAKLVSAMNSAEAANAAKSTFLSNMSHEIRTPMNSIIGMTNLALKTHLSAKQHDYLSKINYASHHLLDLINDILDFSKIEANKLELEKLDFELHTVFDNLSRQLVHSAASKGLILNFAPDSCLTIPLRGDPLRLAQVLLNYTSNAIKFTDKGEITVRAKILDENEAGMLIRFEVQDTGIGIAAVDIEKLFQVFHQADASTTRKYGGTGLGLAICKQLVEMMGGTFGVESQPLLGSTFWFTARLAKGNELVATAMPLPLNLDLLKEATILLVEDNLFNQQVSLEIMREAGVNVSIASNGQEAIEMLKKRHFDCVLMDVQMPVMDGFEATRQIRRIPALADNHIIAMTANAGSEDRVRCFDAGMDNFISKPFFPEQLFAVLMQCVTTVRSHNNVAMNRKESMGQAMAVQVVNDDVVHATDSDLASLFDLSVLGKMMDSDPVRIRKFVLKFIQSARQGMDEIEAALEQGNMVELATLGHRNKSPARTVGAQRFADLCVALEQLKHDGSIEQARPVVEQMRVLLERMVAQSNKEMA